MFNEEFYPTPPALIEKMLKPYKKDTEDFHDRYYYEYEKLSNLSILEPSAGKGDIVDYIREKVRYSRDMDIQTIEQNPDLQSILKEKGYPVIANDFLNYRENYFYDLIIMNPPFSNGDEHLLHALEIAKNTDIVCLLNAETIRNPHSKKRELLLSKLQDLNAEFEFLEGEFAAAERKTNVEVVIVRVTTVDETKTFEYEFGDFEDSNIDVDFDIVENQVARQDLIGNLNLRYEEVRKHYKEFLKAEAKFKHYKKLFCEGESFYQENAFELDSGSPKQKFNYISQQMKAHMWRKVIKELDVEKYMSKKVRDNFEAFIKQQSNMAFTKENVASFFQMIMNNRGNIWDQAVEDVFDELTRYYTENRHHVEGWRTNDRYKINRKIILPNWVKWKTEYMDQESIRKYGAEFAIDWGYRTIYNDLDKVLAYLSGHTLLDHETISTCLENHFRRLGKVYPGNSFENTLESAYFKIKFFKKGTVHLEFKDKDLWDQFNMTACATKNWLPDNERTKWEEKKRQKRQAETKEQEEKVNALMLEENFQETLF
jgi:hypothetical protein